MKENQLISLDVIDLYSENKRSVTLPHKIFGQKMNNVLLKKVTVFYQQANQRSGTASTKNKKTVHGSGRKMRAQKRTGRARMGSKNMPHHRGGAVAFGPNGRSYERSVNKKERSAALFLALSEKVRQGAFVLLENLKLKEIKTKNAVHILQKAGMINKSLFIDNDKNEEFILSTRNLFYMDFLNAVGLNALSIMMAKKVFMTINTLNYLMEKHA